MLRAFFIFVTVLVSLIASACVPTLSQPRGDAHLASLARADRLHAADDFDGAAREYETAAQSAERRVDREEARYRRTRSLLRAGRRAEALAELDALAANEPISRNTVRALYDASSLRLEDGDAAGALAGFERIVRSHPDHGLALRSLDRWVAQVTEAEGPEAGTALLVGLDEPLRESDLHDYVLFRLAERALVADDRIAAERYFARVVAEHPYPEGELWDDALVRLADLAEESGDADAAVAHLSALTSRHEGTWSPGSYTLPTMPLAELRIAELERDVRSDLDAAEAAFQRLYDDYPTSRLRDDALFGLGDLMERRGRMDDACALYRRVVSEFEVGRARRIAATRLRRAAPSCD